MRTKTLLLGLSLLFFFSCEKYRAFDSLEVVESTFSGSITINETVGDLDGIYSGLNDSGTYSFIWDNPSKGMVLNVENQSGTGTVQFVLEDSRGNEVLHETLETNESRAFSEEGKKGKWKATLLFSNFTGEGSFDLNPIH